MSFYPNAFNLVLVLLRRYYSSSVCFKRSIFLLKPRRRLYSFVEIIKSNIPKIEFVIFIASDLETVTYNDTFCQAQSKFPAKVSFNPSFSAPTHHPATSHLPTHGKVFGQAQAETPSSTPPGN